MHHVLQILSKLKRFIHVLPQVNFSSNFDARWSENYAEQDERSVEPWCGLLKFEHGAEKGWELLKRMKQMRAAQKMMRAEENRRWYVGSYWRRKKSVEDVGDVEERIWIFGDLPQTQEFSCPHENCLRLSGMWL